MSYSIDLRLPAENDISEAAQWYETQTWGLGFEFLRAVDAAVSKIERNPEAYPVVYKRARRILLRRFPYSLFYVVQDESVHIIACIHAKRDPKTVKKTLSKR